jgi:hypothetical protein
MSNQATVRIDRLVIDGANLSPGEAREVARLMAERLSDSWQGEAPSIARTNVRTNVSAPRGLAIGPLAEQIATAVRRTLG